MRVDGKHLRFDKTLWVQHGGVNAGEEAGEAWVEGLDEDSYLKVFNHFGRVFKLYTFEGEAWVDAETGSEPLPFDDRGAGHIPAAAAKQPGAVKPAAGTAKQPVKRRATAKPKAATKSRAAANPSAKNAAAPSSVPKAGGSGRRAKAPRQKR